MTREQLGAIAELYDCLSIAEIRLSRLEPDREFRSRAESAKYKIWILLGDQLWRRVTPLVFDDEEVTEGES